LLDQVKLTSAESRPEWQQRLWGNLHSGLDIIGSRWKLAIILGGVLTLATAVIWWAKPGSPPERYVVTEVTRGTVARTVAATGTVNPVLTIIIGSYVSGVISDMSCDYNTQVKKGQLCAKIDPRPYQAALDQAKGQLARDSAQLGGARIDLARYAELQKEDSIARQTYEDEQALVHQLEGSVQLDRAAVETAQVNLDYTNIISPVDGTVVARNITIGQTVAASFQTPTLFLIATDLTKMQVDTNVSESDIGTVKEGDAVSFTVEAFTDRSFQGTVTQVRQAPQTVQNVVTYDVVVGVDNTKLLLKPGMTATVGIVTDRRNNVLRIPDQALRFSRSGSRAMRAAGAPQAAGPPSGGPRTAQIWVLRDGKPIAVAIRTDLDDETYTEVAAGDLWPGDEVIVGEQRGGSKSGAGPFRFGL
jgi:HlyD family secretion protein